MSSRPRHRRRRASLRPESDPVAIRVFSRHSGNHFRELQAVGPEDDRRFAGFVEDQVHDFPRDPLIISINGHQPWLADILRPTIRGNWTEISELSREVQSFDTMRFPERASKQGGVVPWVFVLDHINVPHVYYWSVGSEPPDWDEFGAADMAMYRFRTGVWMCGRGACRQDPRIPVIIIFTKPSPLSERILTDCMFEYLCKVLFVAVG